MTPPDGRQLTLDQLRQFQLLIMACRPADVSQKPVKLQQMYAGLAQSAPLGPGWREDVCRICAEVVHMGPRQRAQWEVSPESLRGSLHRVRRGRAAGVGWNGRHTDPHPRRQVISP